MNLCPRAEGDACAPGPRGNGSSSPVPCCSNCTCPSRGRCCPEDTSTHRQSPGSTQSAGAEAEGSRRGGGCHPRSSLPASHLPSRRARGLHGGSPPWSGRSLGLASGHSAQLPHKAPAVWCAALPPAAKRDTGWPPPHPHARQQQVRSRGGKETGPSGISQGAPDNAPSGKESLRAHRAAPGPAQARGASTVLATHRGSKGDAPTAQSGAI